jgi:acetyl esterase/lipase
MRTEELERAEALYRSILPAGPATIEEMRDLFDQLSDQLPSPEGTEIEAVDAGGVAAEWVCVPQGSEATTLVWFHGGGYALGSPRNVRAMVARIVGAADARALSVDYRLAPEHQHPAAVDDGVRAVRWLYDQGVSPGTVVIGGDSAGGGLAALTMLALRDADIPLPAAAILVSPWTDLSLAGSSIEENAATDVICSKDMLVALAQAYTGPVTEADPSVSPLHAELRGLPPLLLLAGRHEILRDDAIRMGERARDAGVAVASEIVDDVPHVWPLFASFLPEGAAAIETMAGFIQAHVAADAGTLVLEP